MQTLLWMLLGCGPAPDAPWWEQPNPCPEGVKLTGEPTPIVVPTEPPGPIPPEERQRYLRRWQVACIGMDSRIQGRASEWYGNGQLARQYEMDGRELRSLTEWDERGRRKQNVRCTGDISTCEGSLTHWHHDGGKAIEGRTRGRKAVGIWREWDDKGTLIGEVDFGDDGTQRAVRVATSKRLLVADLMGFDLTVAPSRDLELPETTATGRARMAVNLVISDRDVVVDGEWLCDRGHASCSEKLADRLAEKREAHQELAPRSTFDGKLLVQADRRAPATEVASLLQVASGQGYRHLLIVGMNPLMQLPPFDGPPRVKRGVALAALDIEASTLAPEPDQTWQDLVRAIDDQG